MRFKQWLESDFQKLFPFYTEEDPINTNWIKRFKSPESYIKWRVHSGRKTEQIAEKELSFPVSKGFNGEEIIVDFYPDYFTFPSVTYPNNITRPERKVAFVHAKTTKMMNPKIPKWNKPRHRLLAFWQGAQPFTKERALSESPIGGVSWIGNYIDTLWVGKDFRGLKPNLFGVLMEFARRQYGAVHDPQDKLTSLSARKSFAKYDWKRAWQS